MHNGMVSPLPLGTGMDGNNVQGEYSMNERGDVSQFRGDTTVSTTLSNFVISLDTLHSAAFACDDKSRWIITYLAAILGRPKCSWCSRPST